MLRRPSRSGSASRRLSHRMEGQSSATEHMFGGRGGGMMPSNRPPGRRGMEIRARMRQGSDGRWEAQADSRPAVVATGPSKDRCAAALRRSLVRSMGQRRDDEPLTLVIEVSPLLAGVAEAAQVMGWDKRRVITYIDRGKF